MKIEDIEGTKVFVQFTVGNSGNIKDAEIMKGKINDSIDKQIVDILASMTLWTPAYQFGKPIERRMVIPLQLEFEQ